MKKNLIFLMMLSGVMSFSQNCGSTVISDTTGIGENITTGGTYEYTSASDFDVEFGTILTVNNVKFNVLKGAADLAYVSLYFYKDDLGKPGDLIRSFENVVPDAQTFKYTLEGNSAYEIDVDLLSTFALPKGKYYLSVKAKPGDSTSASWEINNQETTKLGRFDFSKFDSQDWFGGFSYYDHIFQVSGVCTSTGEHQPDYGVAVNQGNPSNNYEASGAMRFGALADDIIVPQNAIFTLSKLKITTLQLGNLRNATIKIRSSVDDKPGEVLHTFENMVPKTENYFGYWTVPGYPLDVVAVKGEFEFDEPAQLPAGKYFIDIKANPVQMSDYLGWEASSLPGIGSYAYTSFDDGETWEINEGYNFVFDASGYSRSSLAVDESGKNNLSFYPNPVSDVLTFKSSEKIEKIMIYNTLGQIVKTSKPVSGKIDVFNLLPGNYVGTVIFTDGRKQTVKIIKK